MVSPLEEFELDRASPLSTVIVSEPEPHIDAAALAAGAA